MSALAEHFYLYISPSGDAVIVKKGRHEESLYILQGLVDGWIERVPSTRIDCDVWCNEEALFREGFGINLVASYITGRQIVGPCVLTSATKDGETISLAPHIITKLKREGLIIDEKPLFYGEIKTRFHYVYA